MLLGHLISMFHSCQFCLSNFILFPTCQVRVVRFYCEVIGFSFFFSSPSSSCVLAPASICASVRYRTSTSRKTVRRDARKNVRQNVRRDVRENVRKNVARDVRNNVRKNVRRCARKSDERVSEYMSERTSTRMSEDMSERMLDRMSGDMPEQMSERM